MVRASKSKSEIEKFFTYLKTSLDTDDTGQDPTPPTNIFNFKETYLSDDPGSKKAILKRGVKYPEKAMNTKQFSTSITNCYKATDLHPFNPSSVLRKLPAGTVSDAENADRTSAAVSDALLNVLATMRRGRNGGLTLKKKDVQESMSYWVIVCLLEDLSALSFLASSPQPLPPSLERNLLP
ncbi:hypothetical protein RRG08_006548 [Elysia crispata]|uniref:Uncharacterized protein n=1 Tax=Elysia crispata TaxID=231223 RepID=A0AAE1E4B3_9GAST|nr:hypothetical protein RRG08_006548 [Elysia crispata]